MNTSQFPPPLPPADLLNGNTCFGEKAELSRKLAAASLLMPLLLGALNVFSKAANNSTHTHAETLVRAGVFFTVLLVGTVLAVIALCNFRRGMKKRVLMRAVLGLMLNGSLVAVFITGFTNGRRNARIVAQNQVMVENAVGDVRKEARRTVDRGEAADIDLTKLEKANRQMAANSANLSGDARRIANANAVFTERALGMAKSYQASLKALMDANVFQATSAGDRAIFPKHRKVVQAFIASAQQYKEFQSGIDNAYGEELRKQGVRPASLEEAMKGFRRNAAAQNPVIVAIREADVEMGNAMLDFLDLLETRWGKWTYAKADETVTFDSETDLEFYRKYLSDYEAAAHRQITLQRRALNDRGADGRRASIRE